MYPSFFLPISLSLFSTFLSPPLAQHYVSVCGCVYVFLSLPLSLHLYVSLSILISFCVYPLFLLCFFSLSSFSICPPPLSLTLSSYFSFVTSFSLHQHDQFPSLVFFFLILHFSSSLYSSISSIFPLSPSTRYTISLTLSHLFHFNPFSLPPSSS